MARIFLILLTGVFLAILVANLVLGPTVTTYLRTAVQTEELPSLNTLRRARNAMDKLRPLITAAQGELAPGNVAEQMPELFPPAPSNPAAPPPAPPHLHS